MVAIFVAFMFVSLVLTDLTIEKWQRMAGGVRRASHESYCRGHGVRV